MRKHLDIAAAEAAKESAETQQDVSESVEGEEQEE